MPEILPTRGVVYIDSNGRRVIPFLVTSNVVRFSPEFTQAPDFAMGHEFQMTWGQFLSEYERIHEAGPAITSEAELEVEEGVALAHTLEADEEVTWEITGGADAALFDITVDELEFVGDVAPAFDTPEDEDEDGVYEVTVTATDSDGLTESQNISITVTEAEV